jgi:UDP-N-acetyl-D-mannosaminuronic acid dehydrogenase
MAFKAESDDSRSSLSYKLKKLLRIRARRVLTTDPYVQGDPELKPLAEVINESDLLIVCTPHAVYKRIDMKGKPVLDVWQCLPKAPVSFPMSLVA